MNLWETKTSETELDLNASENSGDKAPPDGQHVVNEEEDAMLQGDGLYGDWDADPLAM